MSKDEIIKIKDQQIDDLKYEVDHLKQQLGRLRSRVFDATSERRIGQIVLDKQAELEFSSEEKTVIVDVEKPSSEDNNPSKSRPSKPKNPSKRTKIPAGIERIEIVLEPEGIDTQNNACIGEKVTEVICYEPAKIKVIRYIRKQYLIQQDDDRTEIAIAPYPSELPLKGANADASILTYMITSKFLDHLPIARQLNIFRRFGIEIKESTYYDWMRQASNKLKPLYDLLLKRVQNASYIQADESTMPLQVKGRGKTKKCYNWFYFAPEAKAVLVDFQLGRSGQNADHFFDHFKGKYVQCDGYAGYNHLENSKQITLMGCWAHARRKFIEAESNDRQRAEYAIRLIRLLYKVERWATDKGYSPQQRWALRQKWSVRIIKILEQWGQEQYPCNPPKMKISEAIAYMLKNINRLKAYTQDGNFIIDNNPIENKVRPSVLGRKNFLFVGSENGGQWAAMHYSFFATCKLNDINPQKWLENTLRKINSTPEDELESLLPIK